MKCPDCKRVEEIAISEGWPGDWKKRVECPTCKGSGEVENKCPDCGYDMKEYIATYICRNAKCKKKIHKTKIKI